MLPQVQKNCDLVNWGFDTGNTDPDNLRLTVAARRDAAVKLVESGMSQRQAAKVLGVHHSTVQADMAENPPKSGGKSATKTGAVAVKQRRAQVAAVASSAGVTPLPTEKYRIVYAGGRAAKTSKRHTTGRCRVIFYGDGRFIDGKLLLRPERRTAFIEPTEDERPFLITANKGEPGPSIP